MPLPWTFFHGSWILWFLWTHGMAEVGKPLGWSHPVNPRMLQIPKERFPGRSPCLGLIFFYHHSQILNIPEAVMKSLGFSHSKKSQRLPRELGEIPTGNSRPAAPKADPKSQISFVCGIPIPAAGIYPWLLLPVF